MAVYGASANCVMNISAYSSGGPPPMGDYPPKHHLPHEQLHFNHPQSQRQLQWDLFQWNAVVDAAVWSGPSLAQTNFSVPTTPLAPAPTLPDTSVGYPNQERQEDVEDQPVGFGTYGVVWAVTDPRDGKRVALKMMPKVFRNLSSCKQFLRELKVLSFCKHENILSILDVVQPPHINYFKEIYLVTELMETNLHSIIGSPQVLTSDHIKVFMYQILRGVKYLHSAGILHRDLKPGNMLVNSNCLLKICDFGMARAEEPDESVHMTRQVVTLYYRAPELLMGAKHYSSAIDIWSVGCIFGELLGRHFLFKGETPIQQLDLITDVLGTPSEEAMRTACEGAKAHILKGPKKQPDILSLYAMCTEISCSTIELLCMLLEFDPSKRISACDALSHNYLREARLRYHSSMCTCCSAASNPVYNFDSEPVATNMFDRSCEKNFRSMREAKKTIHRIIQEHQKDQEAPLCINPQSTTFDSFMRFSVLACCDEPVLDVEDPLVNFCLLPAAQQCLTPSWSPYPH